MLMLQLQSREITLQEENSVGELATTVDYTHLVE